MSENATYQGPLAFFRKHWNGDYSLGRSYWVNTLLVSLFAPALGLLLFPLLQDLPARYSSAAVLALTVFGLLAWTWAISGTWASANKHVQRGGKQGWANAAKVMIVLGILRTVGEVGNMSGSLAEHWRVALGGQLGPQYTIQLSADGKSVVLKGGMNDGAAEALTRALDMAPAVNTVVFSSTGGWVREGNLAANIISQRKLATYVEGECTSACTIAFLAGSDRAAGPNAHIGFHQFKSVGESGGSAGDDAMARAVYERARVSKEFITRIVATPPEKVWYPTHDELLAANVITRKSTGGEIASAATRLLTRDAVVAELKTEKAFSALAQKYPEEFEKVTNETWERIQRRQSDAEVFTAARLQMMQFYSKLMPLASDEALLALSQLILDQATALRTRSAEACVELVFPTGKASNASALIPPDLARRELDIVTQMILSADQRNRVIVKPNAMQRIFEKVGQQLSDRQIQLITSPELKSTADPAEMCSAVVAYLKAIDSLPPSDRKIALRSSYGAPK